MKHLIIGNGEIGSALKIIFDCDIHDLIPFDNRKYDVIHIAFPYSDKFIKYVNDYQKRYKPKYTVIHSTVPIGTSRKLKAIHSPVTGIHPRLSESIKTFKKFVGGKDSEVIVKEFKKFGIKSIAVPNSNDTEAGKLYGLLMYGINILLEKEIYDFCKNNKLDYKIVYKNFIKMYNDGYKKLGMNHIKIYELDHKNGPIGGHCIISNAPFLNTKFSKILKSINNKYI